MRRATCERRPRWPVILATILGCAGAAPAADTGWLPLTFVAAQMAAPAALAPGREPPVLVVTGVPTDHRLDSFSELNARPATPQLLWEAARTALSPSSTSSFTSRLPSLRRCARN